MAAAPGPQSLRAPCSAAPSPAALSPRAAAPGPPPRAQRWFFSREQLHNTPSRRCGVEPDRELSYRQQAANLIQDMGQRLNVSQLTINTAIVYMHRFYMHHSFTKFHRNAVFKLGLDKINQAQNWNQIMKTMSPTTLFLAAKVEEQPRKLEHVIKVAHACLNPTEPPLDTKSNAYLQQAQELVLLESIILQALGFEVTIDHPHTDVVKCTQLVRASKDLAQTSYFMATNSLHLTTFCLQHRPTVIACVCIHLACKWSNWEIPVSTDGKHWWEYVDPTVTLQLLDELTHEFLQILEKTPSRLKRIRNWRATQAAKKPRTESSLTCDALPGSSLLDPPPSLLLDPPPSLLLDPPPSLLLPPPPSDWPVSRLVPAPAHAPSVPNASLRPEPSPQDAQTLRPEEGGVRAERAERRDVKKERRHHHGDRNERRPRVKDERVRQETQGSSDHRGAPQSPSGGDRKRTHNHRQNAIRGGAKVYKSPAGSRPHLFSSDSPRDVGEHRH